MIKNVLTALMLACIVTGVFAQPSIERSVVASGGGTYSNGSTLSLDYTIGEPVITTVSSIGNILTQGFQQPFSSVNVSVNEETQNDLELSLWPNPAVNFAEICIYAKAGEKVNIRLVDLLGRNIGETNETADSRGVLRTIMNIENITPGYYFVCVRAGDINKTLKILKISS